MAVSLTPRFKQRTTDRYWRVRAVLASSLSRLVSAMPAGFFYLLVEDNRTSWLAGSEPPWGRPLRGLPADGDFHMTDWHDIAHGLLHRARTPVL